MFIQCSTQLQEHRRITAGHQLLSIVRCTFHMSPAISGEHPLHCRATLHVQLDYEQPGVLVNVSARPVGIRHFEAERADHSKRNQYPYSMQI